eukprot:scaffold6263_cov99-Isochrysis_galbana.AAC.2
MHSSINSYLLIDHQQCSIHQVCHLFRTCCRSQRSAGSCRYHNRCISAARLKDSILKPNCGVLFTEFLMYGRDKFLEKVSVPIWTSSSKKEVSSINELIIFHQIKKSLRSSARNLRKRDFLITPSSV